jgi:hypothetical protein
MIESTNSMAIITSRVALLEAELKRQTTILEGVTHKIVTRGIWGSSNDPLKFITAEDQARELLDNKLTKEQYELVRSGKRDKNTSRFRGEVICELYRRGVSGIAISRVLKKDHNSVYYHLAMAGLVKAKGNKQFNARKRSMLARIKRKTPVESR